MEDLKAFFGEEAITYEQFSEKLNGSKDVKLANLKKGGYIDIEKLQSANKKSEEFEGKYNELLSNTKDYDDLKKQIEEYKTKEEQGEKLSKLDSAGIDEKYKKFVFSEVNAMVDEKKDFATALAEYTKDNPHFLKAKQQTIVKQKSSTPNLENGDQPEKTINQRMNSIIRRKDD